MNFLKKRPVAAVIMLLAILAGVSLGQSRKPAGEPAAVIGQFAYILHNEGNAINQDTAEYIEEMNESLFAQTGAQIVIDVVKTTGDSDIGDYAGDVFTRSGIGSRERNNGLLLVLALENLYNGAPDGDYYIAWGSGFTGSQQNRIEAIVLDTLEEGFAAKQYDRAVRDTFDGLIAFLEDVYHVSVTPGRLPGTSGSYNAIAGGYASTPGPDSESFGTIAFLGGLLVLVFVLLVWWIIADAFRYRSYRRRYLGPGLPPPPVYYPVFWGRPRRRRPPPPPPPRPPVSGGGSFGGGAGRSSRPGGFSGGGAFGGGAGRDSRPGGFSGGGSFGGGAGRGSRSGGSFGGGARRSGGGGMKRSGGGGMHRTGGSRGGGRRR